MDWYSIARLPAPLPSHRTAGMAKIGKIVVQDEAGSLSVPPGQGVAQSAVHGAEPVQFLLRQIPDGGPHISEHQNTRTMVKDSPPRAFTRRSYQMASKIPSTAPATAAVYCTATLVLQASMIRYPARNRITGIR